MHLEKRTRVEIFLPIGSDLLQSRKMMEWLADELAYAQGGSSLTSLSRVSISAALGDIVRDRVQVLFCDFHLDLHNESQLFELTVYVDHLRLFLRKGLREEEIWITCHPILRAA